MLFRKNPLMMLITSYAIAKNHCFQLFCYIEPEKPASITLNKYGWTTSVNKNNSIDPYVDTLCTYCIESTLLARNPTHELHRFVLIL